MTDNKEDMKVEEIDPNSLQIAPNAWNVNVVSPENEKKLMASIERLGFFKPVIVRTLESGKLEIVGGEHRWRAAREMKMATVPVVNLGKISDTKAKEISLVDNGRYGADDTLLLSQLLESLGTSTELGSFMPYDTAEIESIFSTVNSVLDQLEIDEEDEKPPAIEPIRKVQDFQIMRFKVPMGDVGMVTDRINQIMKDNRFTEDDSLTNAGMALVSLCQETK